MGDTCFCPDTSNWIFSSRAIKFTNNGFSDTPLHFSRFFPLHKLEQLPPTPVEILYNAAHIAKDEGIKYVYIGNVPGNDMSNTICPSCNSTVIERVGYRIASNAISQGKCKKCGHHHGGEEVSKQIETPHCPVAGIADNLPLMEIER